MEFLVMMLAFFIGAMVHVMLTTMLCFGGTIAGPSFDCEGTIILHILCMLVARILPETTVMLLSSPLHGGFCTTFVVLC
ncbi:hypothetical protein KP509_16G071400 [Ceratopteris richardii]|uniref:Uncharacterized protein n=1 Tax=Ceratopteris richardii TaxID=49495 RepID=A0A8T2T5I0_CERRI|nr:hypothetical protein KP509_16G071400 [Ceratopteris richardii]